MEEEKKDSPGHQNLTDFAKHRPRDEHGHFVQPSTSHQPTIPHTDIPIPGIAIEKTSDENTLVDVRVNNPLQRIIKLLDSIRRQKAFSFTLKGSMGIMGVFLTLSLFGIFGGGKLLCDRGTQTRAGELHLLKLYEVSESSSYLASLWDTYILHRDPSMFQRAVLLSTSGNPVHVVTAKKELLSSMAGQKVMITGNYDSCEESLSFSDEKAIEPLTNY